MSHLAIKEMLNSDFLPIDIVVSQKELQKSKKRDMARVNRLQEQIQIFNSKAQRMREETAILTSEIKEHKTIIAKHRAWKRSQTRQHKFSKKSTEYMISKNPKNFENVLEKMTVQYSHGKSRNRSLRSQIDNLRREKIMRDKINLGLEAEVLEIKERLRGLGREVEEMEQNEKARRQMLSSEKKRVDNKNAIANLGIKKVAERLQKENRKTKIGFFENNPLLRSINESVVREKPELKDSFMFEKQNKALKKKKSSKSKADLGFENIIIKYITVNLI